MSIKAMTKADFKLFWPTFSRIVKNQETYAYDPNINFEDAYKLWCSPPKRAFIYEQNGEICGSYYITPNAKGPGAHICNCGYMVDPSFRGRGIAQSLYEHSLGIAKEDGFKAMVFNTVVATNVVAVYLWKKMGFQTIGTIPKAYLHKSLGYVDCHIMYKEL